MSLSNLNKTSPANYQLVFSKLPFLDSIRESNELTLNIYNSIIPSLTLEMQEQHWQGATRKIITGELSFEPWFISFLVDDDFNNWYSLYHWVNQIHNNKDRFLKSPKDYCTDLSLYITNNKKDNIMVVSFINAFVNFLGEVNLSVREGSEVLESTTNIMYDRYEINKLYKNKK